MRRIAVVILVLGFALAALGNRRQQNDWTGGPRDTEPDTAWSNTFYTSDSVNFYYFEQLWLAFSPNLSPVQNNIGTVNGAYYVKAGYIDMEIGAIELALMRGAKKLFDPRGIMNPGKVLG